MPKAKQQWPADKVERRKVADLVPYARNSRTHSDAQVAQIAASIREWGWTTPILVDEEGGIIAGHGRVMAAQRLGIEEVPCMVARGWSEAQRRAYVIADNKLALNAGWDDEMLRVELGELEGLEFDLGLTGFSDDELAGILEEQTEGLTDPDDVPEVPEEPRTKPGDVWILGRHRIICGDSSDPECVAAVCPDGFGAVVLDPPYEMSEKGWSPWIHDPCVLFGQAKHLRAVPADMWRFERVVVKRGQHRSATVQVGHMHAFVAQVGTSKRLPGTRDTFPSVVDQEADLKHPHQKPVDLIVEHLTHWTPEFDVVFDPYAGSGSTIIAAEKMGRSCGCVEKDPAYVDVAVKRWQDFTGQRATLEATGEEF